MQYGAIAIAIMTERTADMSKTVLITGGSRGIGRACAKAFAAAGYRVAVIYNNAAEAAEELVAELISSGTDTAAFRCDVASFDGVGKVVADVKKRFGNIDVLVNNAGIAQIKLFTDITESEWDRMFDVNVKGVFNFCSHVVPGMVSEKKGRIINVSSMWGITGASCEVHYSASKAAVIGFTKALAQELGPSGITVNCIAPGVIATDMNSGLDQETMAQLEDEIPLMRIGEPEEVAASAVFLASEGASYITGQILSVNGGMVV